MEELKKNKKMNKVWIIFLTMILLTSVLTSCKNNNEESKENSGEVELTQVYYMNSAETKIQGIDYNPSGTAPDELVEEYLKALSTDPKNYSLKKAKPDKIVVERYDFNEDGRLSLYFNSEYNSMSDITEVLCRAAIVKTLSQIKEVDSIEFYVNDQPLMGANEKPIGLMTAKDFIDNTSAEDVLVTVYFASENGNKLIGSNLKITYDGNFSIEQLIIDRLIAGPIEKNMIKSIPEGTELIKVSTKDGICYVDFNDKFLDKVSGVKDDVIIYSVVNSLDELTTINKVQFTINGETKKNFSEDIDFDEFFERNLELVEGSK